MGLYNVVKPCVVGDLHYARPTTAPIEVDDKLAASLVELGALEPADGVYAAPSLGINFTDETEADETPTRRRRRSAHEDGE